MKYFHLVVLLAFTFQTLSMDIAIGMDTPPGSPVKNAGTKRRHSPPPPVKRILEKHCNPAAINIDAKPFKYEGTLGSGKFGRALLVSDTHRITQMGDGPHTIKQVLKVFETGAVAYGTVRAERDRQTAASLLGVAPKPTGEGVYCEQEDQGGKPACTYSFSMEWQPHTLNLKTKLEQISSYPNELKIEITQTLFTQILNSLDTLHTNGIAHRDVSPSNILVINLPEEDKTRVQLIDFGVAPGDLGIEGYLAFGAIDSGTTTDAERDIIATALMLLESAGKHSSTEQQSGMQAPLTLPNIIEKLEGLTEFSSAFQRPLVDRLNQIQRNTLERGSRAAGGAGYGGKVL